MKNRLNQLIFALSTVLLLSGHSPAAYGASGTPLWTNFYSAVPYAMAADSQGNVVVTGVSAGSDGAPVFATVKYSGAGAPLWTNLYPFAAGCNFDGYFPVMAVDSNGNVFLAGASCNRCPGYPPAYGCLAYATLAYSNSGLPLWTNLYGPESVYNVPHAMAVDRNGNVFVTGTSLSPPYGGIYEYATVAYSGAGAPLWTNRYSDFTLDNEPVAVAADRSGNVFVTGTSQDLIGTQFATVAYSNSGVSLWTNVYSQSDLSFYLSAAAMAVDASGNVFVAGTEYTSYSTFYATVAYSNSGEPLWTNLYNGTGDMFDNASSVAVDSNGHVFVTGTASVETESGYVEHYSTLAYSSAGVPLWTNQYQPAVFDGLAVPAVAVDTGGNIFITGDSFDSSGDRAYATVGYSGAGVPFRTNLAGGVYSACGSQQPLALDSSGNVFVTGFSDHGCATIKYGSSLPAALIQVAPRASFPGLTNLIVIAANNASACVTLDGSASSDPDNAPLIYHWFNDGNSLPFSSEATATDCLSLGTHNIALVVTDSRGVTDSATLTVEVISCCTGVGFAVDEIQRSNLSRNEMRPLLVSLAAGCESFQRGDPQAGIQELRAFQRKVQAQVDKSDPALGQRLIEITQAIISAFGER